MSTMRQVLGLSGQGPHITSFLLTILLAGCSGSPVPEALPQGAVKLDPAWAPLLWTGGDLVLFRNQDSFFTYDVRKATGSARVASGPVSVDCVDWDNGEVHFARLTISCQTWTLGAPGAAASA